MQRTIFLVLAATLAFAAMSLHDQAKAGIRQYMICWMTPDGAGDCAWLPDQFHFSWVDRPYCNGQYDCVNGTVSFVLTDWRINQLGAYVDTTTMYPTHTATIYAPR